MLALDPLESAIRSRMEQFFASNEQKVLVWIYYINSRLGRDAFLPEVSELSNISRPSIYRAFEKMDGFHYINRDMKINEKEQSARGKKWSLKLELVNGSKEKAEALYDVIVKDLEIDHDQ